MTGLLQDVRKDFGEDVVGSLLFGSVDEGDANEVQNCAVTDEIKLDVNGIELMVNINQI